MADEIEQERAKDQKRRNNPTLNDAQDETPKWKRLVEKRRRLTETETEELKEAFLDQAEKFDFEGHNNDATTHFSDFLGILMPSNGQKQSDNDILFLLLGRKPEWSQERTRCFLDWLQANKYGHLLQAKHRGFNIPPLIYGLAERKNAFVGAVLELDGLNDVIQEKSETGYGTCLHKALDMQSCWLEAMIQKCRNYPDLFGMEDVNGNTPLHMLVSWLGEEDDAKRLEDLLNDSITKPPLKDTSSAELGHVDMVDGIEDESYGCGSETSKCPDFDSRRRMMEQMIASLEAILLQRNREQRTPYQERIHSLRNSQNVNIVLKKVQGRNSQQAAERALRRIIVEDPVAEYIRTYCIRRFKNRDDIAVCLYTPGEELHIDFDLAGLPAASVPHDFLDRLANHIKFESVLKYVALPRLTVEPSRRSARGAPSNLQSNRKHTADLRDIFNWLRENGVKRIIKATVIDFGENSHRESAIQEALNGFQIESWNWKKVDLSSEVIANSTGVVEEVTLYWSGNYAVMMGWSSADGFGNRSKFKELKRINIFVREGYEEAQILNANVDAFKKQLATVRSYEKANGLAPTPRGSLDALPDRIDQTTEVITVTRVIDNKDFSFASDFKSNEGEQEENPWINCMKSFSTFLLNIRSPGSDIRPVKIAVIDDGIDAMLPHLQRRIAAGKSFSPYPHSTEYMNSYYIPSGRHGTLVATLICDICPKPQLYVARLEERLHAESGGRRITAKSAADAVKWAIDCNVDIISMSWTIEGRTPDNEDIIELQNAIDKAESKKILMFCSTSDQGGSRNEATYPGCWNKCIRIGGASYVGDKLTWVNEESVDFLLPGKRIPFRNDDKKSYSHATGSSLATACASGLAGALLYCDRVLDNVHNLSTTMNMKTAFRGLVEGKSKFPDVQRMLEQRFREEIRSFRAVNNQPDPPTDISMLDWDERITKPALIALMKRIMRP